MSQSLTTRLSERLAMLRAERGLTLDQLAGLCGVSRAALSRLEKAEVSPTAEVLGRLCAAYGITMSRLLAMVEDGFTAHLRRDQQSEWRSGGFTRRILSPSGPALAGEVLHCQLAPGSRIAYDSAPVAGLEHHLLMGQGRLSVTLGQLRHDLLPGDSLRYRLEGPSCFETPADEGAQYHLFLVNPPAGTPAGGMA